MGLKGRVLEGYKFFCLDINLRVKGFRIKGFEEIKPCFELNLGYTSLCVEEQL